MFTVLEQSITKKSSNFLKSDLNKFKLDKNQIKELPKRLWFKGSRHR